MYVKICGLQTAETVAAAVDAGANAVGFVFAPGSARTIGAELARELGSAVPADVETVGVFRNQPIDEVLDIARAASLTTVQLHGKETLADIVRVREAGFRTLRAFSAASYAALSTEEKLAWESERILLDAVEPGAGVAFDAGLIDGGAPEGFWLLAGGLNPDNVAQLAAALRPDGVDVSSGVESSRGVKDVGLIRSFISAARSAG
ncbi:phosphoribosylanthranilate isomerase [Arthrobacter sp. ERGS1:01]|uniref:phosphoribosylanthranilate isomerase n=1 Tax=Arthrobacter sp. ERGS1:01 TaxID=1704044 RepID=UPI0006B5CCC5|nr:phosphoribosylanthranilate isomerase [Arthrobacter sp. ERGS1:01]ALE06892.1 phosphoribosylanthranilate isomerase [Arthrobacter sp. ERGS1:01]